MVDLQFDLRPTFASPKSGRAASGANAALGAQFSQNLNDMRQYGTVNQPDPDKQPQQIHLVGGSNFSTWADLKWARGLSHAKALESSFTQWWASAPAMVELVLHDDRQGFDLVALMPNGIPKHEWALLLGDSLHNYRSAFDAIAWGMAHFDNARPSRPKSVQFPVCKDLGQWNAAVKSWVGEIKPEFQHRLEILQPYNYALPPAPSVLEMIHDLDIQDKHRDVLTVTADMDGLSLDSATFEYEDANVAVVPRLDVRGEAKFTDGEVLGTFHAGAAIESLGEARLRPNMKVQLTWEGREFDVIPMLVQFGTEVRRYLDILMYGLAPLGGDEGDWVPLDVQSSP